MKQTNNEQTNDETGGGGGVVATNKPTKQTKYTCGSCSRDCRDKHEQSHDNETTRPARVVVGVVGVRIALVRRMRMRIERCRRRRRRRRTWCGGRDAGGGGGGGKYGACPLCRTIKRPTKAFKPRRYISNRNKNQCPSCTIKINKVRSDFRSRSASRACRATRPARKLFFVVCFFAI
jgi:hypothetical protein